MAIPIHTEFMRGRTIRTILTIPGVTSQCCTFTLSNQQELRLGPQSYRSLRALAQQKNARNVGRPKLPKGESKGRIVPVRFTGDNLKAMEAAAKASNQNVSEWIRSTIHATLNP